MGRPQDAAILFNYAAAESAYGTATAEGTIFPKLTGPGIAQRSLAEDVDMDEITGHPYTTEGGGDVIHNEANGTIEFKAAVDLLAFLVAALNGNVSTTGAGPYTHTVK